MNVDSLLEDFRQGRIPASELKRRLLGESIADSGFARLDHQRLLRKGQAEVVFCQGKTPQHVAAIFAELAARTGRVLGTRAGAEHFEAVRHMAYDLDAIGICGDENSLEFSPEGEIVRVRTNLSRVVAEGTQGDRLVFEPELRESLCGDGDREITPLQMEFNATGARLRTKINGGWTALPAARWRLRAEPFVAQFATAFQRLSCSC